MKRAQAHRRLLRKVKTELRMLCEQEKVKRQMNELKQGTLIIQCSRYRLSLMQRRW